MNSTPRSVLRTNLLPPEPDYVEQQVALFDGQMQQLLDPFGMPGFGCRNGSTR